MVIAVLLVFILGEVRPLLCAAVSSRGSSCFLSLSVSLCLSSPLPHREVLCCQTGGSPTGKHMYRQWSLGLELLPLSLPSPLRADCSSTNLTLREEINSSVRRLCDLSTDQRVGIYGGTVLGVVLINLTRTISFFFLCVNASRILHNHMFASILRAPILFFDTNPIGRVLNRFSKDVGFLDDLLPYQFCEYMLVSG